MPDSSDSRSVPPFICVTDPCLEDTTGRHAGQAINDSGLTAWNERLALGLLRDLASAGALSDHAALEALFHDLAARDAELLDLNRRLLQQIEATQHIGAALAASQAHQHVARRVFETMTEAVLVTDRRIRIESTTPAFTRITGYSEDEVRGHSVFALISKHHDRSFYRSIRAELHDSGNWSGEMWCRLKNGEAHPIWQNISALRDDHGDVIHYISVLSDMGEIQRARDTAERLSWRDPLTGLANRSLFMRELTHALAIARNEGRHVGVLLLDLDRFKMINAARGLTTGDALLTEVAGCLARLLYDDDLVARLDSDEFAVLLAPDTSERANVARSAQAVAQRIHTALRAGVMLDDEPISLEVSIGVTLFPEPSATTATATATASDVLRLADLAMRQAKSGGGGQTAFFETEMGESARECYELEHALRNAIGEGQLDLYLQDQVDASGRRIGAEALVRWRHPQRGLVSPQVFIPIAEKSDLIALIDRWVLEQVCEILAHPAVHTVALDIAVNISPRHFRMAGFVDDIHAVLASSGASPHRLVLEITEGLFIDDHARASAKMNALRLLGLRFSLDDFGTGYSSLAYLKRLPIHELKIDKSFIQDVIADPHDAALVGAILAVAARLGLRVVAEGVETEDQARFLDDSDGVIRQGYYYGRPEPAAQWLEKLAAGSRSCRAAT
ncbi:MAG: EAL domain-containing protein [Rhodocyclales bacterium]|nr:EAL domain-containing protein [Rhodocyclales bacterium]